MSVTRDTIVDLAISGQGFYTIQAQSRRGEMFMRRVQGNDHGTAHCDDTRLTQDIADAASAHGLRVSVNGLEYPPSK